MASSKATRVPSGIPGFDEITNGGFPRGRVIVVVGGAGSGKTTFALQALAAPGRSRTGPGVFVAFEESPEQVVANAAGFAWGSWRAGRKGVAFLDAKLGDSVVKGGDFDVLGLLAAVGAKCERTGATRVVFDGLDVLLDQLGDPSLVRREIFRLREWVHARGVTAIVTAKADATGGVDRSYAFLEFMSDCLVHLRHRMVAETALRTLRVAKLRGAPHSANEFPFTISASGIEIASTPPGEVSYSASRQRVSTGVARLDVMLRGGYHRGSSVLLTGAPGTAKTSLAAAFAEAACRRGERTLYVSFDEGQAQIERNVASIGIDLRAHVASGVLAIHSLRARSASAETHVAELRRLVAAHAPRAMVIDPISALLHAGERDLVEHAATHALDTARSRGITLVSTSLLGSAAAFEETPIGISTVADTWIHLTYLNQGGERNRAITVVKSRGTRHSNQVRELVLSDDGITLSDVYSAGGTVLMGTLRWEKENAELSARAQERLEREQRERHAVLAIEEAKARLQMLGAELSVREAELTRLRAEARLDLDRSESETRGRLDRRGADAARGPSRRESHR
jgi:circadian clock protein KaiC